MFGNIVATQADAVFDSIVAALFENAVVVDGSNTNNTAVPHGAAVAAAAVAPTNSSFGVADGLEGQCET